MWVTSMVAFGKAELHLVQLMTKLFCGLPWFGLNFVGGDVLLELMASMADVELTTTTLSRRFSVLVRFSGGGDSFEICFALIGTETGFGTPGWGEREGFRFWFWLTGAICLTLINFDRLNTLRSFLERFFGVLGLALRAFPVTAASTEANSVDTSRTSMSSSSSSGTWYSWASACLWTCDRWRLRPAWVRKDFWHCAQLNEFLNAWAVLMCFRKDHLEWKTTEQVSHFWVKAELPVASVVFSEAVCFGWFRLNLFFKKSRCFFNRWTSRSNRLCSSQLQIAQNIGNILRQASARLSLHNWSFDDGQSTTMTRGH